MMRLKTKAISIQCDPRIAYGLSNPKEPVCVDKLTWLSDQ
jgi:hypothetical protein